VGAELKASPLSAKTGAKVAADWFKSRAADRILFEFAFQHLKAWPTAAAS